MTENSVRNDTQRVALEDKVSQVISEDILWLISRNYFYLCFGKHHLDVQSVFVKINVIEESQLGA